MQIDAPPPTTKNKWLTPGEPILPRSAQQYLWGLGGAISVFVVIWTMTGISPQMYTGKLKMPSNAIMQSSTISAQHLPPPGTAESFQISNVPCMSAPEFGGLLMRAHMQLGIPKGHRRIRIFQGQKLIPAFPIAELKAEPGVPAMLYIKQNPC